MLAGRVLELRRGRIRGQIRLSASLLTLQGVLEAVGGRGLLTATEAVPLAAFRRALERINLVNDS